MADATAHHRRLAATLALLLLGRRWSSAGHNRRPAPITGIVTDSSGAAIVGAQVSITNRDTRYVRIVDDFDCRHVQHLGPTSR